VSALRELVGGMLDERFESGARGLDPVLAPALDELVSRDVERSVAMELLTEAREVLSGHDLKDPEARRGAIVEALARRIDTVEPASTDNAGRRVIALVGPTGVGKTTTVAKLAAVMAIGRGRKVRLVSADSFRMGSAEQIKVLGSLLNVPVTNVLTPADLTEALSSASDADAVIIDTAGRNYMNPIRMNELRALLGAVSGVEVYLVLSACVRRSALKAAGERFGVCRPRGVILTKLDEATCLGGMADLSRLTGLGCAYLAWGQDVSRGIEKAGPERMARLAMGQDRVEG
jgi:flagellar biosynthesis protein FlhF